MPHSSLGLLGGPWGGMFFLEGKWFMPGSLGSLGILGTQTFPRFRGKPGDLLDKKRGSSLLPTGILLFFPDVFFQG